MKINDNEELIKILHKNQNSLVNARELHAFLAIKTQFNHWIKRMLAYLSPEDIDYTVEYYDYLGNQLNIKDTHSENQPLTYYRKEYIITLNMAKEIAIIQRNSKGKQAREYFINCEKKLIHPLPDFNDPIAAARAWADAQEAKKIADQEKYIIQKKLSATQDKNELAMPLIKILQKIQGLIDIKTFSRETYKIFKLGPLQMFDFLRKKKILFYHWSGSKNENFPYQKYVDQKWFEIDSRESKDKSGRIRISHIIMITAKGRIKLCQFIQKNKQ